MTNSATPKASRQVDGSAFAASAASAVPSSARVPSRVTPVPIPTPGSRPSVPPPQPQPSTPNSVPAAPANDTVSGPADSEASTSAPRPLHDAIRPMIRDGRVRSPMPGKLKGKLDKKSGMFGVMLMSGPNTSDISKRDAEAKRASESTQLAAEKALAAGQGSSRRAKFVKLPQESEAAPFGSAPPPPSAPTGPQPYYGLTDAQIKAEQARLLTVLRSLNPISVVDQLCTALAFFGGIPGAPPPPGGAFPPSALANGSGRHFVSWIAEIFPPVPNYGPPMLPPAPSLAPTPLPAPQDSPLETGPRKRGRPKGSKSSRPRKDKGIKKGPSWARPEPAPKPKSGRPVGRPKKVQQSEGMDPAEESWVDVDQDDDEEDEPSVVEPDQAPPSASAFTTGPASPGVSSPLRTTLPSGGQAADSGATPKRRGRPKGSKTRAKQAAPTGEVASASVETFAAKQLPPVPPFGPPPQPTSSSASFTPVNTASVVEPAAPQTESGIQTKRKPGRPKGSKTKPKGGQAASTDASGVEAVAAPEPAGTVGSVQQLSTAHNQSSYAQLDEVSPSHQGSGAQTYSRPQQPTSATQPPQTATPVVAGSTSAANPTTQSPVTTQKRKRKAKNSDQESTALHESTSLPVPTDPAASHAHQSQPVPQPAEASLAHPPAKRQRKSKEPKASAKAPVNTDGQASGPNASAPSDVAPDSFGHTFQTPGEALAQAALNLDVDRALSSLQPPHDDSHFDVESPTMENYQAQLQAQLEQESDPVPAVEVRSASTQSRVDPRQLMAMHQQQQQQQQYQYQQHQQKQQQQQRQHQSQQPQKPGQLSQTSAAQARSPPLQLQAASNPQQESPMPSQPTGRASQNNFGQYRPANAQYGKPQTQAPQQANKQFSAQQHNPQVNSQATQSQQYLLAGQQQQQYNTAQQQYSGNQAQYTSGQQASAQSRYPQPAGASGYTATQSQQFTPTNNSFNASDGSYRGPAAGGMNLTPQYASLQRTLSANSASNNRYRNNNNNNNNNNGGNGGGGTQNRSPSQQPRGHQRNISSSSNPNSNTPQQGGLQPNTAGLQGFPNAGGAGAGGGWDLLDGGASTRSASSAASSGFGHSSGTGGGFDASGGLGGAGNERFYGMGRR